MIAHKAPRIEPPSTGSFGGDSTQDWELANAAISFGQTLLSLSLPHSLFPSPRSAAMIVSLLLYLFPLLHLGYALVANPSASRSSSSSSHPSLGVPKSSAHCSDCERLLSSRIKEKQEVERVKHRIMVAIRSTNSDFAMPSSRFGATVTAAAFAETSPPRGVFSDGDDSGGKESGEKAAAVERRRQAGGRPRKERKKYATVKRNREMTGLASHLYDQGDDDVDGGGDDDNDDGGSSREWSVKKNVGGPDIVTFSKVLISRRRRNVLQFKLSSVEPEVQNLEVVKARLWLLLHG
ncbi:uncharacterized protein LOC112564197 isoform X2 [Pomacea canaliculata]|nr:uncharacterized protein LOC112564197 isoform X2 [Pomacea canaliculata]